MGSSKNSPAEPSLPFPIFMISTKIERYLLYDINTITWLRRTHNILGVLIGTLPQFPQQNVFLGLPLELQPEEARFLVEEKLAYVINDFQRHDNEIRTMTSTQKEILVTDLRNKGKTAAMLSDRKKDASKQKTMRRLRDEYHNLKEAAPDTSSEAAVEEDNREESLFSPPSQPSLPSKKPPSPSNPSKSNPRNQESWAITPTTSPLPISTPHTQKPFLPTIRPSSYALFKHLHNSSYFLSPGLRFGCQFLAYPGDPLRFHSHFLTVAVDWDEEIDLLDLIGGGRLGTGVKKGWLIGGVEASDEGGGGGGGGGSDGARSGGTSSRSEVSGEMENGKLTADEKHRVRTFCIEWGGM